MGRCQSCFLAGRCRNAGLAGKSWHGSACSWVGFALPVEQCGAGQHMQSMTQCLCQNTRQDVLGYPYPLWGSWPTWVPHTLLAAEPLPIVSRNGLVIKMSGKAASLPESRMAPSGHMCIALVNVQPPNSVPIPLPALRTMRKTDQQATAGLLC